MTRTILAVSATALAFVAQYATPCAAQVRPTLIPVPLGPYDDISVDHGVMAAVTGYPNSASAHVFLLASSYPVPTWIPVDGTGTFDQIAWGGGVGGTTAPSVSTDGVRIAFGATANNDQGLGTGAVFVFNRVGGAWTQERELLSPAPFPVASFGTSVAIDGDTLAASTVELAGQHTATTCVFARAGSSWGLDASFGDRAGNLALQGSRLVIGREQTGDGEVWLYEKVVGAWAEQIHIVHPGSSERLGSSVALDGDVLAIGASHSGVVAPNGGATYVFTQSAGAWVQEAILAPNDLSTNAQFGVSVALKSGNLFVCAPETGASAHGSVYVFQRSGLAPFSSWTQVSKMTYPAGGAFAQSVSYDGQSLIVGSSSGALAYQYPAEATSYCTAKTNSAGCVPSINVTGSLSVSGPDDLRVNADSVLPGVPGIMIWSRAAATIPFGGGTLCLGAPIHRTPVQYSTGSPATGSCSGTYSFAFTHTLMYLSQLLPGSSVCAQYYSRDNGFPVPQNVGLTDAIHFIIRP